MLLYFLFSSVAKWRRLESVRAGWGRGQGERRSCCGEGRNWGRSGDVIMNDVCEGSEKA